MTAGVYPIAAEQGARLYRRFRYETETTPGVYAAINLTGYTARMWVRHHLHVATPLIRLPGADGTITLGGVAGTVEIDIPATTMANAPAVKAQYDIELIPPTGEANAIRFVEGFFNISPEVTR